MSSSFNPDSEEMKDALRRVQRARISDLPGPVGKDPAPTATQVGPEEFKAHMALEGPTATAVDDLEGCPVIDDTRQDGYVVRGRVVPNASVKRFIIEQTAAGLALTTITDAASRSRFPSLFTIKSWLRADQAFFDAFQIAREIRGERLGEQALQVALDSEEENVKSAKLKHEALSRHAARMNKDFQDKQVIETKADPIAAMTLAQSVERLRALMSIPAVAQQVALQGFPLTLDAEPARRLGIIPDYEDPMDAATPLILDAPVDLNHYQEEEDGDVQSPD
jgi:hypothetical protein